MSNLRTDYTDAVWVGSKRYIIGDNGDGSSSITDITSYTNRENSFFGAADANAISGAINRKATLRLSLALPASGWSESAPYTQTVAASGVLATDTPIVDIVLSDTAATAMQELDAYALMGRIDTSAGAIKATCYDEAPQQNINLQIMVVR